MRPGAAAASSSLRPGFLRKVSLKHQGFIVCQCSIPVLSLDMSNVYTYEREPDKFSVQAMVGKENAVAPVGQRRLVSFLSRIFVPVPSGRGASQGPSPCGIN